MHPQPPIQRNPVSPNITGLHAFVEDAKAQLSLLPYLQETAYGLAFKGYPDNNTESMPYLYQGQEIDPATAFFNDNTTALSFFYQPDPVRAFDSVTGSPVNNQTSDIWLIFHGFTREIAESYGVDPYFSTPLITRDLQQAVESAGSNVGFATFSNLYMEPQNIYQGFTGLNRMGDNLFTPEKFACRLSFNVQYSIIPVCQ